MNATMTALNFMKKAHAGQKRWSGKPYWTHPFETMRMIDKTEKDARIVALLHDVCEDTPHWPEFVCLTLGLGKHIEDALIAITKRQGEEYFEYIDRVKANKLARKVKRMDLLHNMRTAKPHTKVKYQQALTILEK